MLIADCIPRRYVAVLLLATMLAACAGQDIDDIKQDATTVAFVQHGEVPLAFSTGVIDSGSFWATYGDSVSAKLGGNAAIDEMTEAGKEHQDAMREHNELVVDLMYDRHDLAATVNPTLLADLAALWELPFDPADVMVVPANSLFVDPRDDTLKGMRFDADLVLVVDVHEVRLTERFSAGSALASGVTLGANEKRLTIESPVDMRAFRRNEETGALDYVWGRRCGANYTSMQSAYPLDTLWKNPDKMEKVLDEARDRTITDCRKLLDSLETSKKHHR